MKLNQLGLTLLETVMVLLIAGLIISGVWIIYAEVRLNNSTHQTLLGNSKTVQIIRDYLSTRSDIPASLSKDIHDNSLMPSEFAFASMAGSGGTTAIYITPFSTTYFVSIITSPPSMRNSAFAINFSLNPNPKECLRLMPKLIGTSRAMSENGIVSYSFGGINSGLAYGTELTPPDAASLTSACAGAASVRLDYTSRP